MKALKAQGYGSKPNESDELTDSDIDKPNRGREAS